MKSENIKTMGPEVAEIQLSYKKNYTSYDTPKITSSESAFKVLLDTWDLDTIDLQEAFRILLLNRANCVIGQYLVSTGSSSGTVVDPKLVFSAALLAGASAIILCHNHPSGNKLPSQADIDLTRKLKMAGEYLDLKVLDHLIITGEKTYYSFADEGML